MVFPYYINEKRGQNVTYLVMDSAVQETRVNKVI